MEKQKIINQTIKKLQRLSDAELKEASDFIDFLLHKIEDQELTVAIQKQAETGKSFSFLEEEEELYSRDDLKKCYS